MTSKTIDIEKTRQEIYDILDDPKYFFPYLSKSFLSDTMVKILSLPVVYAGKTLLEQVEKWHERRKRIYHLIKGTEPFDYSRFL